MIYFRILFFLSTCFTINLSAQVHFKELRIENKIYKEVSVRKVSEETITIFHSQGITQIKKNQLPESILKRLPQSSSTKKKSKQVSQKQQKSIKQAQQIRTQTKLDKLFRAFGTKPQIYSNLDLRAKFNQYGLYSKDQGFRPSCSIFAVNSCLEFISASTSNNPERFSEEYLIWATRELLGQNAEGKRVIKQHTEVTEEGFSLYEVMQAIRAYGVANKNEVPNTFGKSMSQIASPSEELIESARQRSEIDIFKITGRTTGNQIDNIIHLLNSQVPVAIGLRWPAQRITAKTHTLHKQNPKRGSLHAVTLVGYEQEDEQLYFIFRNSWGHDWGQAGHGYVSAEYLLNNLIDAYFLTN